LLGGVFDGLLRPLDHRSVWLERTAGDPRGTWVWQPSVDRGARVSPGEELGRLLLPQAVAHRVLVPADLAGEVEWVAPAGEHAEETPVATVAGRGVTVTEYWPVRRARPVRARLDLARPLHTGQRVIDLLYPVALGSTAAVPGGFGTGKTVLLQQVVRWCSADVLVFVGCGERGNELADALTDLSALTDPRTGRPLVARTVVIANTSNMPVMAREASVYTAMTVAEYYRDMGLSVVLLADSTSRWAEALREFASRRGELPVEEGFPAGLGSALAAFYQRAGRVTTLGGREGAVTLIGAVSPPGGDMTEPVTAHTERLARALWSLDRDLAYARHYPAISWRRSFSLDAHALAEWGTVDADSARDRTRALGLLAEADRLSSVVELVGLSALPARERIVLLAARLLREGVLQQNAESANDATCAPAKQAALLELVLDVLDVSLELVAAGVPVSLVEETDLSPVTRARDDVGPEDAAGVRRIADEVRSRLEALR
jgi:V/A-type H+-transporting ATPase subunit A